MARRDGTEKKNKPSVTVRQERQRGRPGATYSTESRAKGNIVAGKKLPGPHKRRKNNPGPPQRTPGIKANNPRNGSRSVSAAQSGPQATPVSPEKLLDVAVLQCSKFWKCGMTQERRPLAVFLDEFSHPRGAIIAPKGPVIWQVDVHRHRMGPLSVKCAGLVFIGGCGERERHVLSAVKAQLPLGGPWPVSIFLCSRGPFRSPRAYSAVPSAHYVPNSKEPNVLVHMSNPPTASDVSEAVFAPQWFALRTFFRFLWPDFRALRYIVARKRYQLVACGRPAPEMVQVGAFAPPPGLPTRHRIDRVALMRLATCGPCDRAAQANAHTRCHNHFWGMGRAGQPPSVIGHGAHKRCVLPSFQQLAATMGWVEMPSLQRRESYQYKVKTCVVSSTSPECAMLTTKPTYT